MNERLITAVALVSVPFSQIKVLELSSKTQQSFIGFDYHKVREEGDFTLTLILSLQRKRILYENAG